MRILSRRLLAAALFGLATVASAQGAYPARPITMIVPAPAGGLIDNFVTLLAEEVKRSTGQPLVMDHRGGAGGIVGTRHVAQSAPDGYTLLMANVGPLAILPSLDPSVPYDANKDFAPIAPMATFQNVLVVHPSVPAQSVAQLVDLLRQRPGKMSFASAGVGQSHHLSGELFKLAANVDMVHVPYKGAAPAMNDLLGGHVHMMFANLPLALKHVQSGTLRALAVTGAQRSKALPQVPTMAEAGVKDYVVTSWIGVVAPAGTPAAVIEQWNGTVARVLRSDSGRAQLERVNADPAFGTPAEFQAFMQSEQRKWRDVIRKANIKPE